MGWQIARPTSVAFQIHQRQFRILDLRGVDPDIQAIGSPKCYIAPQLADNPSQHFESDGHMILGIVDADDRCAAADSVEIA